MALAPAFLDRLAARSPPVHAPDPTALEGALMAVVERATARWPELSVDPVAFVQHVAGHIAPGPDILAALHGLHADELWLAFACHRGDGRAMAALERTHGAHIEAAHRAVPAHLLSREDHRQLVRDTLFVADAHGRTKIGSYAGQGSLAAWLRIAARRIGLNAVRSAPAPTTPLLDDDPFDLPASLGDPELDYLKQTYREQFREAFGEAVAGLPARERTLLRQSIAHRITVREIGRMHQVHHATAARWVADARLRLVDDTRAALQRRLEISKHELDSIMGLIASRLDVSVARVLGPDDAV